MRKPKAVPIAKTSLRLPKPVWDRIRIRAIQENRKLDDICTRAFELYLKGEKAVDDQEKAE